MKKGIDVSYANPGVDLSKASDYGYDFVIIRLGITDHIDKLFTTHYERAKKAGLDIGTYWWITANSADEAKVQAETALRLINGKKLDLPFFCDFEDKRYYSYPFNKDRNTNIITAFLDVINRSNYDGGLYINPSTMENFVYKEKLISRYPIWLAHWTGEGKVSHYDYGQFMQQYGITKYGDTGICVDGDYLIKDYFKSSTGELKPVYTVAKEVWDGKWGNGDERRKKLESAGYTYAEVQKAVSDIGNKKLIELFVKGMLPEDYEEVRELIKSKGYDVI